MRSVSLLVAGVAAWILGCGSTTTAPGGGASPASSSSSPAEPADGGQPGDAGAGSTGDDGGAGVGDAGGAGDGGMGPLGQACTVAGQCGATLGCVAGVCAPCTQVADCGGAETCVAGACQPSCTSSLQSLLDGTAAAASVTIPACVYREAVTVTKAIDIVARPGAGIRGSDVWSAWSASGATWVSSLTVPDLGMGGSQNCETDAPLCYLLEQVFVDGTGLTRVQGTPKAGEFALDTSRHVIVASNPAGHLVEVTTRKSWLIVNKATGVSVTGFTMEHAANLEQTGAFSVQGATNFTLTGAVLTDAHGAPLGLEAGSSNLTVSNVELARGGQEGFHIDKVSNLVFTGSHVHDNNVAGYSPGWEAGGGKASGGAGSSGLVFSNNESNGNDGPGLWCDVGCVNAEYSGNRVHDNTDVGIQFEISSGAKIHDNVIYENGWGDTYWVFGSGIMISSSANAQVYDNVVAWNGDGINVISQDRPGSPTVAGNSVYGNTVILQKAADDTSDVIALAYTQDASLQVTGTNMFAAAANNVGHDNAVWWQGGAAGAPSTAFQWGDDAMKEDGFTAFVTSPGGKGDSSMTDAARDTALSTAGAPATQAAH